MKTAIPAVTRRRLFIAGNTIARTVLKTAVRPDLESARADLAAARAQIDDLLECTQHQMRGRKTP